MTMIEASPPMVLRFLTALFLLIFAFMSGVIFGLKSNPKKEPKKHERIAEPSEDHQDLRIALPQKPTHPLVLRFKNKERSGYTLVLAAFKDEVEAAQYAEEIHNKEKDAFYFPQVMNGQTWYRVAVGSFTLKSTAESLKKELSYYPYGKKSVITKIPSPK